MIGRDQVLSELLAVSGLPARAAHLRERSLTDAASLNGLLEQGEQHVHGQPEVAVAVANVCEAVGRDQGLLSVRARASYLLARVAAQRGDLETALTLIDEARRRWTESGERLAALRTDLGRMQVLDDLGRHPETGQVGHALLTALAAFDGPAHEVALCRQLRATASNNLGAMYCLLGDHEQSLAAYAVAEEAYRELGLRDELAQPQANRGIALLALGQPREALGPLRSASALFTESGDPLWEAKCNGYIAQAHQQLGELLDALRMLHRSQVTLHELGADAELARNRLATAGVYLTAGLHPEARAEAEAAAAATAALGLRHDNAIARYTLALALLGAGDLDEAESELGVAAAAFDALGDRQYLARTRLAQVELAALAGDRSEAARRATAVIASLEEGGWLSQLAGALLQLADLAPPDRTAAVLTRAGALVDELRLPQLRYAHRVRLAHLRRREGRSQDAERLYRECIQVIEGLGANLGDPTLHVAFRTGKLDAHDGLVDLLVARGSRADLVEACRVSDQAKAQTLIDVVDGTLGAHASPSAGAGSDQQGLLERRRADLTATYNALAAATSPSQTAALRAQADREEAEVAALRIQQAVAHSGQDARPESASPTSGPGIDATHPATLSFHIVGDDVIVFVIGTGAVQARRLQGARPALTAEIGRLAVQWSRFQLGGAFLARNEDALAATSRDSLETLYRLLIGPVEDLLADLLPASVPAENDLRVVPHRILHQVPFHALYDGHTYLNERWTIVLSPIIGSGSSSAEQPQGTAGGTLILAVPDEQAPEIEAEAEAVAAVMPNSYLALGEEATVQLLRERLPGPAFLHLACHGLYRPTNPMFSALRLADRWISTAEILELRLDGAVVTLSACESGRPGRDTAEPVSLAWAFLAAGASGALVSQWIVDDSSTAQLMADTYAHLATGHRPAAALRLARRAAAHRSPHPFHWAPFAYVAAPSMLARPTAPSLGAS